MKKKDIYKIEAICIIIDQVIKLILSTYLKLGKKIVVIPNFFKIYYIKNNGAAFSIFENKTPLLIGIGLILFIFLHRYIKNNKITSKYDIISLGLILGGLVGNLIDRLLFGGVLDYLSFTIFGYNFAIFNFADICIVIGTIILIIDYMRGVFNDIRSRRRKHKNR